MSSNNISIKLVEQRQSRQDTNNKVAYDTIKNNKINPNNIKYKYKKMKYISIV